LEEISAKVSLEFDNDYDSLVKIKNLLKLRLKQKMSSKTTLKVQN